MDPEEFPNSDEEAEIMNFAALKQRDQLVTSTQKTPASGQVKPIENGSTIQWDEDFPDFSEDFEPAPVGPSNKESNLVNSSAKGKKRTFEELQADVSALLGANSHNGSNGRVPARFENDCPNSDEELELVPTSSSTNHQQTGANIQASKPKKRTFEELCSDVSRLLNEDISGLPRVEVRRDRDELRWDEPERVIEAIRKKKRRIQLAASSKADDDHNAAKKRTSQQSISNSIPKWDDFIALTRGKDFKRLYIKVRPVTNLSGELNFKTSTNLLSTKFSEIKEKAHLIMAKKLAHADDSNVVSTDRGKSDSNLWVDKYRPKSYIELLSDETVNRNFLHWLKLWDKVVFNREPVKKEVKTRKLDSKNSWKGGKKFDPNMFAQAKETVDKSGMPIHRIVLLHGPPGLGKTTLAHVVAKQVGYNVVEINASNDRSPEAFKEALLSSTQMQSMIGKDPRPNCLVLDEIDGAPPASIDLLIKFVQGKLSTKKKKGKSAESSSCKRPIVCICNELYTLALRPLRTVSYVINVPKITAGSLADRLMTIARNENINIHHRALLQLAENSGCDIRSCLLTLQFKREKCSSSNQTGDKSSKKGIFEFWKSILQVPMERTGPSPVAKRVKTILSLTNCDNSERLAMGVFENYLENCPDKMDKISFSVDWFQYFDRIVTNVKTNNDWRLMPYSNYAFVAWHLGFAATKTPKLSYPFTAIEMNQKLDRNKSIVSAVKKSSAQDPVTIILDISPFLKVLLSPRLRSVARTLYSQHEKAELERLINVMLAYGLTFVQEKTDSGMMDYVLEPNLFNIGNFPGCSSHGSLSYAIKQVVFKELQDERIKRSIIVSDPPKESSNPKNKKTNSKEAVSANDKTPSQLATLNPIVIQPNKEKVHDFFAKFKRQKQPSQPVKKDTVEVKSVYTEFRKYFTGRNVTFKYKEGFCNAIRRTVRMENIL